MNSAGPSGKTGPAEVAAEIHRFQNPFGSKPLAPQDTDDLNVPTDFDPDLSPILARHWFGIKPHELRDLW